MRGAALFLVDVHTCFVQPIQFLRFIYLYLHSYVLIIYLFIYYLLRIYYI